MSRTRYFRLIGVDGHALPLPLRVDRDEYVVTEGTLRLVDEVSEGADGYVEWELRGMPGAGEPDAAMPGPIFWQGEEFDRLDAGRFSFPGGFRKAILAPELVATCGDRGLELRTIDSDERRDSKRRRFGARSWQFREVEPFASTGPNP